MLILRLNATVLVRSDILQISKIEKALPRRFVRLPPRRRNAPILSGGRSLRLVRSSRSESVLYRKDKRQKGRPYISAAVVPSISKCPCASLPCICLPDGDGYAYPVVYRERVKKINPESEKASDKPPEHRCFFSDEHSDLS